MPSINLLEVVISRLQPRLKELEAELEVLLRKSESKTLERDDNGLDRIDEIAQILETEWTKLIDTMVTQRRDSDIG